MHDADAAPLRSVPIALLVAMRPRQWAKNLLVLVAPGAAGVLAERDELAAVLLAAAAFCAASAGTYLLNDAADAAADARHPTKSQRPVAAGEVTVRSARVVGVAVGVVGLGLAALAGPAVLGTVAAYLVLTSSYTIWLKHLPVVDIVAVAAGFMLRAIAGAFAADVPISDWFFIVASAASMLVVTGKRLAELSALEPGAAPDRRALASYTPTYLWAVIGMAGGIAILAYCLWAFEEADLRTHGAVWLQFSILPFVMGLLQYVRLLDDGAGETPEELVLGDRVLQLAGVLWVVIFGVGIYAT